MLTDRDLVIQQEPDLRRQLVAIVAGAAGERVEFGCFSTGVHDDLHAATQLARAMVTSFGMSAELGPGHDRRARGRGVPRRVASGPGLGRARDARRDRPRGRAARRRGDRQGDDRCSSATGQRSRRPPRRCSSTRRCPASRSTRCCRPCSRCRCSNRSARALRRRPPSRESLTVMRRLTAALAGALAATSWRRLRPRALRTRSGGWSSRRPARRALHRAARRARRPRSSSRPNRGLLAVEGNATVPPGLCAYDGAGWHQLSTVCGGPGRTTRIAWAGPREFWTITVPSQPRHR